MSKGRKRARAKAAAKAARFGMAPGPRPPPPGGFGPPHPMPPPGPMMPADHIRMGPLMMEDGPPDFLRNRFGHGQGFHPQEFEMPARCPHPDLDDGPQGFHPDPYEGPPGFHPQEFEGAPLRFAPPEFRDGPPGPGFIPPEFRDGPPGPGFIPPEFRDGPPGPGFIPPGFRDGPPGPGFIPPEFRDGPPGPGFIPPEFRDGPPGPGFIPPEFRDGPPGFAPLGRIWPSQFEDGPGYPGMKPGQLHGPINAFNARDSGFMQQLDVDDDASSMAADKTPQTNQESSGPGNNEDDKSFTTTSTEPSKEISVVKSRLGSVKPPPGRSMGVIVLIANSFGTIEYKDPPKKKKYPFSFDAFFGNRKHLVPGVKVHFTAVKESGKVCATDVKVAPGGTEDIEDKVYEGVVTAVLPETYVLEPLPGRIKTILTTDPVKLPFGKMDSNATLLLFDRVKFQLLTDIITKARRATNITPQMPETFQLTKEIREKGLIMSIKDDTCTIMSNKHDNLTASINEYLSDDQLNIMDEVEYTVVTLKDKSKAIRLKKLPEGSVEFDSKEEKVTDSSAGKSLWKPVNSQVAAVDEDISSTKYEGTVSQIIPKNAKNENGQPLPQGLVNTTVDGTEKSLPFGLDDVITQATMMIGDKVQFNLATKQKTKEEHAINIEILPETFQLESKEQRKIGTVVKLDDKSGFIKAQQEPQLFFDLSEVMDDAKLTLSEKVEFTLAVGSEGTAECKQAIRIRKLTESVFTAVPKIEEKKEKKKMTIKLLKDPKEQIKDEVMTSGKDCDLQPAEKPSKDKVEASKALKQDSKGKQENPIKGSRERSRSREHSRRRGSRSNSRSRDRSSSYYGKHRSSSRDRSHRSHRRSRSRSRDRSHRYRRSYSRSRSRSRERSSRSTKKRSHSPEKMDERRRGQSNKTSQNAPYCFDDTGMPSSEAVNKELAKKRKELLELNELIARKKAIIAMEQNAKTPSQFQDALEMDTQHGIATFDYQHKTCLENSWTTDVKPVRSILKKHSDSLFSHQKTEESKTKPSSEYTSDGSVPMWIGQSPTSGIEDQELARKKRQLEELSECIARKRAIMALEQKAKALSDGSEIKKKYDFASCTEDLNINMTNSWQLDIKPDLQPKKSILKKQSESIADQSKKPLTSVGQYAHCPMSKQPTDDGPAFLSPSGSSDTAFKTPCNPSSVLSNTVDLFKKLINEASASSHKSSTKAMGQQSFQPSSGLFYDQKSSIETKVQNYSTLPSQLSQSYRVCDQASTSKSSSTQSSATERKSNLATQMERFLGALNKADSNLLSSLLKGTKKDTDSLENQGIPQEQAGRKVTCGDELYDPFQETDCKEDNSPLMGSKLHKNLLFGLVENTQDDLLPHERAVVDGSGFSKIVGMKYGVEAKPENRFPYGDAIPSSSQSRLLQEHEKFLKECDKFKRSQDRNDVPYFEDSYAEDRKRYKRQSAAESYRIEGSLSPVHHKSEDAKEDTDQTASQYKKIQDLLQTIGLNLDTTEVSKLADRTNERLYGKKVKPGSSLSFDQRDKPSVSRYDRRGSSNSTDSEDVGSVSPAKTSNREVYMSYWDSLKNRPDEVAVRERELSTLKRTIRNIPEAKQSDAYKTASPEATHDPYKLPAECSSIAQSFSLQYTQISSEFSSAALKVKSKQDVQNYSYAMGGEQNPYGSISLNPQHYTTAYPIPSSYVSSGYGDYLASAMPSSMMPPSPVQFCSSLSTFTTPGSFGTSPTTSYPSTLGQFGFAMQPDSSGYVLQQGRTKKNRCLKTIETVQTQESVSGKISAAKEVHSVISIQTEKPHKDSDDEAESQMVPMMEDDIKAKQKKRLEQFNQRMRLKKEQQIEAQRTRGLSQKSAPGTVIRTEVKNVWICGHSLVFWAEKRATSPEIGMQLGMDPNSVRVWWKGVQGMTWQQLLPQLLQLKDNWPKPDVILIHLGGNDIGTMTPETFVLAVKKDLISMKSIFPQCQLVWSDILPRKSWKHSTDSTAVNNMRQAINKTIRGIMADLGGSSLTHENIMPRLDSGLYRPDGVHLSGKGIDTFNLNMQDFLEKWESEISETETSES
ncbi:uncharacterized protein Hap1MRO34_009671 [Clarias gariepinus]